MFKENLLKKPYLPVTWAVDCMSFSASDIHKCVRPQRCYAIIWDITAKPQKYLLVEFADDITLSIHVKANVSSDESIVENQAYMNWLEENNEG